MMERAILHLFGDIGTFDVSARWFRDRLADLGDVKEIEVLIHSPGGDIAEGFSIFHQLVAHPARVIAHVQAFAASMAGVVAMAADEVWMAENAFLVVHNPFIPFVGGEAEDLRHLADLLDVFKANLIRAYQRHTSLSEDELVAMMDEETWLTANDAIRKGFAQVTTGRLAAVNRLDLSRFQHVPASAQQLILKPGGQAMSKKPTPPADGAGAEVPSPVTEQVGETVESLWSRLGQMINRRVSGEKETKSEGGEAATTLAMERQALLVDRAQLRLDQDLGPYRATIEPARLETLEPIMLRLKTADLSGNREAKSGYASLVALLPSLTSDRAGSRALAGSDDSLSLTASPAGSDARRSVGQRHGIDDERREHLETKFSGCRPGALQTLS